MNNARTAKRKEAPVLDEAELQAAAAEFGAAANAPGVAANAGGATAAQAQPEGAPSSGSATVRVVPS